VPRRSSTRSSSVEGAGGAERAEGAEGAGLCATCLQCRRVQTERSTFYLCERSFTDPHYVKYPPLPVRACPGYEADARDKL